MKKSTNFIVLISSCYKRLPLSLPVSLQSSTFARFFLSISHHVEFKGTTSFNICRGGASSCRFLILFHLSNLFQFHSALLPTYPFGNTSSSGKKKKIHIHYPSLPTILPCDWPEGPVSHVKEPVSRWGETRRRAAGSRRS